MRLLRFQQENDRAGRERDHEAQEVGRDEGATVVFSMGMAVMLARGGPES